MHMAHIVYFILHPPNVELYPVCFIGLKCIWVNLGKVTMYNYLLLTIKGHLCNCLFAGRGKCPLVCIGLT